VQIINPLEIPDWNEKVLKYKDYSFFHTKEWCQTLVYSYQYKPLYLIDHTDIGSNIFPIMEVRSITGKKKLISLPFSDYCNPLLTKSYDLQKCKVAFSSRFDHITSSTIDFHTCTNFIPGLAVYDLEVVQKIDAKPLPELFKSFYHNTRGNILKSEKSGVYIKIDNSLNGLNEFYRLQALTRKRHNLPPQPGYFFKNLFDIIINHNMADIFLGYYKNNIIASGLFLKFGEKVLFKYANSDFVYQELRPNNLLTWEAIKYYFESGFSEFDFGKTEYGNEGLRKYKHGFNAYDIPVLHFIYNIHENTFKLKKPEKIKLNNLIFKYAPVSHLKFVGNTIYKYFP